MGYVITSFVNRFDKSKHIRFIYKTPKRNSIDKDAQMSYFWKECVSIIKKRNPNSDNFIFEYQKNISSIRVFIMNIFLPKNNKIITIPQKGSSKFLSNDYYKYTVKKGDTWWDIARRELKSGRKAYLLAEYNKMELKDIKPGVKIRIPYALINENYDRRR